MHVFKLIMQDSSHKVIELSYDESVEVATVAKHLADQLHQFTQYGGVRPNGVSMIIAGIDQKGESIYVTDPSGTYVQFAAIAIGAGSDDVNEFLEKNYKDDLSLEDAASLVIAAINGSSRERRSKRYQNGKDFN